mgnify:CR=1 FL=1
MQENPTVNPIVSAAPNVSEKSMSHQTSKKPSNAAEKESHEQ